jgi:putative nucleotidyltransferase with HDIG domain
MKPWSIVVAYALVSILWLGVSDPLVDALEPNTAITTYIDLAKDLAFVLASAGLIFVLIKRMVASLEASRMELARNVEELRATSAVLEATEDHLKDSLGRAGEATWEWWEEDDSVHLTPEVGMIFNLPDMPLTVAGADWWPTIHPDDRAKIENARKALFSGQLDRYELVFRAKRPEGGWRWLLSSGGLDRRSPSGHRHAVGTLRDISELHQRDEELHGANVALHGLIAVNRAIIVADTQDELLNAVCRILVRELPLSAVWVGQAMRDSARTVQPVARAGPKADYVDQVVVSWGDGPNGHGLAGEAIRTASIQFSNDTSIDSRLEPWRVVYAKLGITSSIVIPIKSRGAVWGVVVAHGLSIDAFGPRERDVLANLGEDIGYALASMATAEDAAQAEIARAGALADLNQATIGTVRALAAMVEARDPYTAGHEMRVAQLAVRIGEKLGLPPTKLDGLLLGGSLHDIGKIGVPAEFLSKPGRLLKAEMDVVREHPKIGREIVRNIRFPWPIAEIIGQHHERIDGSGYPDGLAGDQICIEARVLAVADVVEAMLSHRPYRPGLPLEHAVTELRSGRGTKYWPDAVDTCLEIVSKPGFSIHEIGGGLDRLPSFAAERS